MKPWKISQNFIEKINSSNGAFSGLNNKHLKSLAIRASDYQDLLAQIQRVHTSYIIFQVLPRGFSATCLQQMQGSVVEGLSQTATSGSQCFFV